MEMNNATQAGPSRGLIDLIFGSASSEGEKPEASSDPIAALVKALERQGKKEAEESSAEFNWAEADSTAASTSQDMVGVLPPINSSIMAAMMGQGTMGFNQAPVLPQGGAEAAPIDPTLMKIAGGNIALATMLQKMDPNPEVLQALKNGDNQALLKLIDQRKAELKGQMPALGLLERAIERDGLEKVMSTGSLQELVGKFEQMQLNQEKLKKNSTTEDFLAAKGLKISSDGSLEKASALSVTKAEMIDSRMPQSGDSKNASPSPIANAIQSSGAHGDVVANSGAVAKSGAEALSAEAPIAGTEGPKAASNMTSAAFALAVSAAPSEAFTTADAGDGSERSIRDNLTPRIAHNISFIAKRGGGELNMTINPKEMGEIQLKVSNKGKEVQIQIIAQNAEVASALRSSSNELSDALKMQNINVSGLDITVKASSNSDMPSGHSQNFASFNDSPKNFMQQEFANKGQDQRQRNQEGFNPNQGEPDRDPRRQNTGKDGAIDLKA